jgi:hypothetical protein
MFDSICGTLVGKAGSKMPKQVDARNSNAPSSLVT